MPREGALQQETCVMYRHFFSLFVERMHRKDGNKKLGLPAKLEGLG